MQDLQKKFINSFFESKDKKYCFCATLAQNLSEIHLKLLNTPFNQIKITGLQDSIFNMLIQDTKKFVGNLIIRPHIAEMNILSKNKMLTGPSKSERFFNYINLINTPSNLTKFYKKYAGLYAILNRFFSGYVKARRLFLKRLFSDFDKLRELSGQKSITKILKIESVGDFHSSSQCTLKIELIDQQGKSHIYIYKPIDYRIDQAFQNFSNQLFTHFNIRLFSPKVLYFKKHCWIEYINFISANNKNAISNYINNLGSLIAVLKLINAKDIHFENIISSNDKPYLIDSECLISTPLLDSTNNTTKNLINTNLNYYYPLLGFTQNLLSPVSFLDYKNIGRDDMFCIKKLKYLKTSYNIPKTSLPALSFEHLQEIFITSFNNTVSILLKNSGQIEAMVFNTFFSCKSRILIRNSYYYQKLLEEISHPLICRNIKLIESYLSSNLIKNSSFKDFVNSEIKDLMQFNIPYFYSYSNRKSIFNSENKKIKFKPKSTGLKYIKSLLRSAIIF